MMSSAPNPKFNPELVDMLRAVLDQAVTRISVENRTPATKARMAQRIVQSAAAGMIDAGDLVSAAVEEGRTPAA